MLKTAKDVSKTDLKQIIIKIDPEKCINELLHNLYAPLI